MLKLPKFKKRAKNSVSSETQDYYAESIETAPTMSDAPPITTPAQRSPADLTPTGAAYAEIMRARLANRGHHPYPTPALYCGNNTGSKSIIETSNFGLSTPGSLLGANNQSDYVNDPYSLYIANLNPATTTNRIYEVFAFDAVVVSVRIPPQDTLATQIYGFVEFEDTEVVQSYLEQYTMGREFVLDGNVLKLAKATFRRYTDEVPKSVEI